MQFLFDKPLIWWSTSSDILFYITSKSQQTPVKEDGNPTEGLQTIVCVFVSAEIFFEVVYVSHITKHFMYHISHITYHI